MCSFPPVFHQVVQTSPPIRADEVQRDNLWNILMKVKRELEEMRSFHLRELKEERLQWKWQVEKRKKRSGYVDPLVTAHLDFNANLS